MNEVNEEFKKVLFGKIQNVLEENMNNRITPTLVEGILNRTFREIFGQIKPEAIADPAPMNS